VPVHRDSPLEILVKRDSPDVTRTACPDSLEGNVVVNDLDRRRTSKSSSPMDHHVAKRSNGPDVIRPASPDGGEPGDSGKSLRTRPTCAVPVHYDASDVRISSNNPDVGGARSPDCLEGDSGLRDNHGRAAPSTRPMHDRITRHGPNICGGADP